jgi:ketosteroid isomerase-like protein
MSAEENLSTIKAVYEAFGRGDAPAILEHLTDDVDWAADAASDAAPWYGERTGKDGAAGFFEAIGGTLDVQEFTPIGFAANDTEVMVFLHFRVTVRATGKEAAMNLHHYFRFRDGKIEYYRGSEDTAQMLAALQG